MLIILLQNEFDAGEIHIQRWSETRVYYQSTTKWFDRFIELIPLDSKVTEFHPTADSTVTVYSVIRYSDIPF